MRVRLLLESTVKHGVIPCQHMLSIFCVRLLLESTVKHLKPDEKASNEDKECPSPVGVDC